MHVVIEIKDDAAKDKIAEVAAFVQEQSTTLIGIALSILGALVTQDIDINAESDRSGIGDA